MDYKMKSNDDDGSDSNLGNYTDNNGNHQNKIPNNNGLSKAELRKSNKPIMEKRRRARINHCLNELKSLILEAMQKDPARHTKLEKADILEMTVKHLQSIQRQQFSMQIQTDPTVIYKFKTGFTDCAEEVNRYIGQLDSIDTATRQRLSNHLNNCATGIDKISTFNNFATTYPRTTSTSLGFPNQLTTTNSIFHQTSSSSALQSQDVNNNNNINNNTRINMGGVQLIPSRLPSGELALIMPNTNQMSTSSSSSSSFFMPTIPTSTQQHQTLDFMNTFPRLSAFTKPSINNINLNCNRPTATQTTNSTVTSPPLSPVSSISSLGCDDSIMMHTSSDFISKTPPPSHLDHSSNLSDSFSTTPSSTESSTIKFISRTGNLQQSHVSSTSETTSSSSLSSIRIKNDTNFLRKRSRSDDCQNKLNESTNCKLIKIENQDDKNGNISREENSSFDESNDSMWRPW